MKYIILSIVLFSSCNSNLFNKDFKWGYRVCFKNSNECLKIKAKFQEEKDCIDHLERHSHRCIAGSKLLDVQLEEPVCWKTETIMARSECVEL